MVNYSIHKEHWNLSWKFLHAFKFNLLSIHYISRDHPNAHEVTKHILHPSPAPCSRKDVEQAVQNGSGVTYRQYLQFS
jgi:hypothetical protein